MSNHYCIHCGWPEDVHRNYKAGEHLNGDAKGNYSHSLNDCPLMEKSFKQNSEYQDLINRLILELPGYRLSLSIYPEGGRIDAQNGQKAATAGWSNNLGSKLDDAVNDIKLKLRIENTSAGHN